MAEDKQKKLNTWYFPPDMAACFVLLLIPLLMLRVLVQHSTIILLIQVGQLCGLIGVVLLFFARWPLYRQGQFLTVGPSSLNGIHRKLYYAAYVFIVPSVFLLGFLVLLMS